MQHGSGAKIGVALIGCGDIARLRYLPALALSPDFHLCGIFSRSEAPAQAAVAAYGGKVYRDLSELMGDRAVSAVIITTPHPTHADLVIAALAGGKHVLCEKPMATTLADAERVRAAAEASGKVVIALPIEPSSPAREAKRLIELGTIGHVNSVDTVFAHLGPVHAPWFLDRQQANVGVLADLGVYAISQLIYLLGPVDSAFGLTETLLPERRATDGRRIIVTVEDNVAALLRWPHGAIGTLRTNWCTAVGKDRPIWETRIYGSLGVMALDMAADGKLTVFTAEGQQDVASSVAADNRGGADDIALRSFSAAIRGDSDMGLLSSVDHQCRVIEVMSWIYDTSWP